ncbi:reverse transcriptase (RNA-dependent DNA polymerase) domain-containing protein [Hirsutella rhossiliensis]|uniref:Reverse transcriptase (RNA-dependent DNA polymerase) domain-containing protein n=1 Tax=Hirsutella rhossiliensis TaxID=111463 RepID=A0A9P8MUV6_9HYPO|nr:reverse transcriptase (RNA-dependent DNA polymerase) domain-containing protein [Hirsutella rhossiliensis]KAH0962548.1 reverse transcriptase (RNA-dependent DNA polymerase) domain-containing protein [Hirsutella rhossiliensis]
MVLQNDLGGSPLQNRNFQTPFQLLNQWLQNNNRDTGYQQLQPDITFLKAYGCRAYPLTTQALQNKQKKDLKTDPHTEIGYLVGYDSTNIFRIWIPSSSEVRRVRDVTFNEHEFYEGKVEPQKPIPQCLEVQLPAHIEDESEYEEIPTRMEEHDPQPDTPSSTTSGQEDTSTIQVQLEHSEHENSEDQDEFHDADNPYPTPDPAQSDQQLRRSSRPPKPRNFGSFASSQNHFHSSFFLGREEKLHSRSLPPEPTSYKELSRCPLTWVFKYKFDKHGFLIKFKARLCVRGDLQKLGDKDTYAATLAGKSFRVLMAITAKFDLESRQLDAVNAFANALLDDDEEIYVLFPDGYYRQGWVLRLLRALYGLRRSSTLNDWLTVFFFVDDIVFLYRKDNEDAADHMVAALKRKYAMTDQGELQWFLDQIQLYQSKVGSLNYAACITRMDIAKPASKLAESLNNPSEQHQKLADHLIEYLHATRHLAIQFSGCSSLNGDLVTPLQAHHYSDFQSASDAAFADDKDTRKSSQEAELLALTHTAKETIATFRLFQQLS